jgi:hypothetical protein
MGAPVEDWLLRHTEMDKIGVEAMEKLFKSCLFGKGIVGKINPFDAKVWVGWLPKKQILCWHEDGIVIFGIDLFEVVKETFNVSAGGAVDDTCVDNNMHDI